MRSAELITRAAQAMELFHVERWGQYNAVASVREPMPANLENFLKSVALSDDAVPAPWANDLWRNGLIVRVLNAIVMGKKAEPNEKGHCLRSWFGSSPKRQMMADACLGTNGHGSVMEIIRDGQKLEIQELEIEIRAWLAEEGGQDA